MIVTRACDSSSDTSSIVRSSIPCSRRTISISLDARRGLPGRARDTVRPGRLLRQFERGMNGPQRSLSLIAGDEHGNLDLAGRDHLDVHSRIGQRAEHLLATPVCVAMPSPTTETLATLSSWLKPQRPEFRCRFFDGLERRRAVRRGRR